MLLEDLITLAGLALMLISWIISFRSSLNGALRKWSPVTVWRAFTSGKRKLDLWVKFFGTIGVIVLLVSALINLAPNAIGMQAYAATGAEMSTPVHKDDPEWCRNGPRGCSDYWKLQSVLNEETGSGQQEAINVLAAQAAEIAKGLKDWNNRFHRHPDFPRILCQIGCEMFLSIQRLSPED